jgi:hypothetical protein
MYAYCLDMPGVSEEMNARVTAGVGDDPIPGLIAHVSGPSPDGWRIIDIWESEEHWQQFQAARLGPALARATAGMAPSPRPFDTRDVVGHPAHSRRGDNARV